jgi:hypothetical protein
LIPAQLIFTFFEELSALSEVDAFFPTTSLADGDYAESTPAGVGEAVSE